MLYNKVIFKLDVYNTYFTIQILDRYFNDLIEYVANKFTLKDFIFDKRIKRMVLVGTKEYFIHDKKTNTYRFVIGALKDTLGYLGSKGIKQHNIEVKKHTVENVVPVKFKWLKSRVLRDYQEEAVEGLKDKTVGLIDMPTGYGKGSILNYLFKIWGKRVALLILPKYVEKWIIEMKQLLLLEDEEILLIQGSDMIKKLSLTSRRELNRRPYKVVVMSITTITNYLTAYEEGKLEDYVISPDKLMEHLGCGVLCNDESHQHFHALLRATLYFNVQHLIGSSATLDNNRRELKFIYSMLFPVNTRTSNLVKRVGYVDVSAVNYMFPYHTKIKYMGVKGYSHVIFEQSVMKQYRLLKYYIEMITDLVEEYYIANKQDKDDKLLIFASTVDMCTYITNYLKNKFNKLTVSRYVEQDDYNNIMTSNITVSTLGSAGTALDIPKLITVINTVSVSSLQSNLQSLGRLRKIEGRELWYVYTYTRAIPNQYKLHLDRKNTIKNTVKQYYERNYKLNL